MCSANQAIRSHPPFPGTSKLLIGQIHRGRAGVQAGSLREAPSLTATQWLDAAHFRRSWRLASALPSRPAKHLPDSSLPCAKPPRHAGSAGETCGWFFAVKTRDRRSGSARCSPARTTGLQPRPPVAPSVPRQHLPASAGNAAANGRRPRRRDLIHLVP